MAQFQDPVTTAADISVTVNTPPMLLANLAGFSYQAVLTGAPVGTLKLQMSNDRGNTTNNGQAASGSTTNAGVTNWTDITGSSFAVAAAGNWGWDYTLPGFRWVRLVYTATSGTGSMSVTFQAKG